MPNTEPHAASSAPTEPISVAVLGTGIIGSAVARNLSAAGFPVRVWNRTRAKAAPLEADGARVADTPAEAVRGADVVLTALNDGPRAQQAITAAAPGLAPGAVWVQTSTVGVQAAAELAGLAGEYGLDYVDAPVQGTRQPAEQGQLVILGAAPERVRGTVQPLFDTIGRRTLWVAEDGTTGAASRLKLVLNTWVLALTHGVGEALALAQGLGVDPQQFLDVVAGGPMDNTYLQNKSAAILAGDFPTSFSVDNAAKDSRLVLEAAGRAGVRMDLVEASAARFLRASAQGHGGEDMAAGYYASFPE